MTGARRGGPTRDAATLKADGRLTLGETAVRFVLGQESYLSTTALPVSVLSPATSRTR